MVFHDNTHFFINGKHLITFYYISDLQRMLKKYSTILAIVSTGVITVNWIAYSNLPTVKRFRKNWLSIELLNHNTTANKMTKKEHDMTLNSSITRTVWMLWDKGWNKAPRLQAMCLRSFQRHNPDFEIHAMNLSEAEKLINRKQYYNDSSWNKVSIQAKSDIIRVELLGAFGGVWADATVYCNEPLSNWIYKLRIEDSLGGFFAYERKDKAVNKQNAPWISSWFLIATTHSRIIKIWRDIVRKAWARTPLPPQTLGYFWIHRIFANLTKTNLVFQQDFKNVTFMDAGGPHCHLNITPHVYKTKACGRVVKELFKLEGHRKDLNKSLVMP